MNPSNLIANAQDDPKREWLETGSRLICMIPFRRLNMDIKLWKWEQIMHTSFHFILKYAQTHVLEWPFGLQQ